MDTFNRLAWILLAAIHAPPAMAAFMPGMMGKLYGVAPQGEVGLMLAQRAFLFLAVAFGCLWGALDAEARRPLSVIVMISIVGFLILYIAAGTPPGPLRRIALVDAAALAPLAWVLLQAWGPRAA